MKWKEFKEAVEEQGVKDDTDLDWIDVTLGTYPEIKVTFGPDGSADICDGNEPSPSDLDAMQE